MKPILKITSPCLSRQESEDLRRQFIDFSLSNDYHIIHVEDPHAENITTELINGGGWFNRLLNFLESRRNSAKEDMIDGLKRQLRDVKADRDRLLQVYEDMGLPPHLLNRPAPASRMPRHP